MLHKQLTMKKYLLLLLLSFSMIGFAQRRGMCISVDASAVPPPTFDSGIVLNGTFTDGTNISLANGWALQNDRLYFTDSFDNANATLTTSRDIIAGNYELNFDIVTGGTNRLSIYINGVSIVPTTTYPTGAVQIDFEYTGLAHPSITLRGANSGGGTAYEIDNLSLNSVYDMDAQLYVNAHGGMTIEQEVKVNDFFVKLKTDGVYPEIEALWLTTWESASENKWNLVNPLDTDVAHRLTFGGTVAHNKDGIKSDGTTGYADTHYNANTEAVTLTDISFGFYAEETEAGGTTKIWFGTEDANSKIFAGVIGGGQKNSAILGGSSSAEYVPNTIDTERIGMHIANIAETTRVLSYYHEGVSLGGADTQTGSALPNHNIALLSNNYYGTQYPSLDTRLRVAYVGGSLTEPQIVNFNDAVNSLIDGIHYDLDAELFIDAVATLTYAEKDAIDSLVRSLKAEGLWTKLDAIYPFIGGTAAEHKWNLKDPRDLDAAFRLTFNGGITHGVDGITGDGTSGYAQTYITPSTTFTATSVNGAFYSQESSTNGGAIYGVENGDDVFLVYPNYTGLVNSFIWNWSNPISGTQPRTDRFIQQNQLGGTSHKFFVNGEQYLTTNTGDNTAAFANISLPMDILARNNEGVHNDWSDATLSYVAFGDGLTDVESLTYNDVIEAYQSALGRSNKDPDAQAVIDYVNATDVTLTTAKEQALHDLVKDYKANGFWAKTDAFYGYIGETALSNAVNFKDPRDLDAAFRLTFNGIITHDVNGITGDTGSGSYVDTHFVPSTDATYTDFGWGFSTSTGDVGTTLTDMGVNVSGWLTMYASYSGDFFSWTGSSNNVVTVANPISQGNYTTTQTGLTTNESFKNGVSLGTSSYNASSSFSNITGSIYLMACNVSGTASWNSGRTHNITWIGNYLTPAEVATKNDIDDAYMTAIGR